MDAHQQMVAALLLYRSSKRGIRTAHQCSPSPLPSPLPHTNSTGDRSQHHHTAAVHSLSTRTTSTTPCCSNTPNIPDTWTQSKTHLDANTVHGQTLFRTIQPTQCSRKHNLADQPVLDIFPWQLSRFGLHDQSLRTLSQGRYTGIVATRSIAEAVFTSQLLTDIRAHHLDIDNIAEYLHQQAHQPIPNKTTDAKQFTQPLISRSHFPPHRFPPRPHFPSR